MSLKLALTTIKEPLQLVEQHGVVYTIKSLTQVNRRQARALTDVDPPSRPTQQPPAARPRWNVMDGMRTGMRR